MPKFLLLAEIMAVQASILVDRCGVLGWSYCQARRASDCRHCSHSEEESGRKAFAIISLILGRCCRLVSWWAERLLSQISDRRRPRQTGGEEVSGEATCLARVGACLAYLF